MKKHLTSILLILIFVVGLSVFLYPTVSDYINSINQTQAIHQYSDSISTLSAADYDDLINAARLYNEKLAKKTNRFYMSEEDKEEYYSLLSPSGRGRVIGVVEIPAINVKLPLYHGTGDTVLQVGIGHIEGTSLPIGGVGTHAALSGHRGLPSSILLTNLDRVVVGDLFTFTILDEMLTYEVDQIVVVEPEDMEELRLHSGMDYATLVTCTPYGINSHRLLVRGHRVDNVEGEIGSNIRVSADARQIDTTYVAPVLAAPMVLFLLVYLLIKYRTPKHKRKERVVTVNIDDTIPDHGLDADPDVGHDVNHGDNQDDSTDNSDTA